MTAADVSASLGRDLDSDETSRVVELIDQISALVSAYCRRSFSVVTDDVFECVGPLDQTLELPGRPVHEVANVTIDDVQIYEYKRIGYSLWRRWGWTIRLFSDEPTAVRIVYTHGTNDVPDDVKAIVTREVINLLDQTPGVVSEGTGEVSTTYVDPGSVGLSRSAKASLNRYRKRSGSIPVRAS